MKETNKILITDFIKQYNNLTDEKLKKITVNKIIARTYCPVLEKRSILELMLQKSVLNEGTKYVDLFINRINFISAIIVLYTTLLPEQDEQGNPKIFEMYDLLIENDILNKILENISERELTELTSINNILMDNWYSANTSTQAYVSNLLEIFSNKFGTNINMVLEKIADILEDDKKMNLVESFLEKTFKK